MPSLISCFDFTPNNFMRSLVMDIHTLIFSVTSKVKGEVDPTRTNVRNSSQSSQFEVVNTIFNILSDLKVEYKIQPQAQDQCHHKSQRTHGYWKKLTYITISPSARLH